MKTNFHKFEVRGKTVKCNMFQLTHIEAIDGSRVYRSACIESRLNKIFEKKHPIISSIYYPYSITLGSYFLPPRVNFMSKDKVLSQVKFDNHFEMDLYVSDLKSYCKDMNIEVTTIKNITRLKNMLNDSTHK